MPLPRQRRTLALLAAGAALTAGATTGLTASAAPASGPKDPSSDATVSTGVDSTSAVVGLSLAPLATDPSVAPAAKGNKRDFNSSAAKSERAKIVAQRHAYKKWLQRNAPKAQVTGEYDVAVNAVAVRLNGTPLSALKGGPGVTSVGYQGTYRPSASVAVPTGPDPDLSLINASPADPNAGAGVKVGVIDTGIDVTHPCFAGGTIHGYTNDKVIIARVFANKAAKMGYDAKAVQDHGTHVAGTIACNAHTRASIGGSPIGYAPSGVAPAAKLGSYNVFPGDIVDARSEDILNALDAAAGDGMDVINMSLGGDTKGVADLLTNAVNNLDKAGIVVAVSAGNSGPGHFTVGSPGSAERALTAGAASVGHFMSTPVTIAGTSYASNGDGDFPVGDKDLSGLLLKSTLQGGEASPNGILGIGCTAAGIPSGAQDKIVMVSRGSCAFAVKVANARAAGAKAVIVVNSVPGDPIAMAGDPTLPLVPAVMVSQDDFKTFPVDGSATTISAMKAYYDSNNDNIMGDFSSQGPTDVDLRVKPDLVAPGVNVLSSIPNNDTYCDTWVDTNGCWAFFNGTSMASPHLAGTAAVVVAQHPDWSAEQVRSAITNTAQRDKLFNYLNIRTKETDPLVTGAGLADVKQAIGAQVALSSVSSSFGSVPAGSGQKLTRTLTFTQLTSTPLKGLPITIVGPSPGQFSVSANTLTPATKGATQTVTLTFTSVKGALAGDRSATLALGAKGDVAHSVLYALVK
ncbi:MAG: S8 family serine peptidase [Nocardioidaceae bacterium]